MAKSSLKMGDKEDLQINIYIAYLRISIENVSILWLLIIELHNVL